MKVTRPAHNADKSEDEDVCRSLDAAMIALKDAMRRARLVSIRLRSSRLNIQKTEQRYLDERDAKDITKAEYRQRIAELLQYIKEKERDIETQQRFFDNCLLHSGHDARYPLPSIKCVYCGEYLPISRFSLRTAAAKGQARHWMISPVCRECDSTKKNRTAPIEDDARKRDMQGIFDHA